MSGLIDLTGKNAVVTGGSRGVGRATALLLARAGATVGIGYRTRQDEADAVVEELRALGVHAWAQGGDLGRPRTWTPSSSAPTRSSTASTSSWATTGSGRSTTSPSPT